MARLICPTTITLTSVATPLTFTNENTFVPNEWVDAGIFSPPQIVETKEPADYDAFASRVKNQKRKLPKLEMEE